ncbi:MAG: DUF134 domain-containing protein [Candidatus Omnitrophica bacterium]|nr:DUF134 domain-containing protein [Candidatus Omnitrophota bacterium]MBU1869398.1 DUF134 domain-containing protein [Candidatus Omnitrophota bacterium]
MQARGRPKKYRIVRIDPKVSLFSPRGRPGRPDLVELAVDEFEAIRLADFMGFGQKEAAISMHISQQTFSRILKRAHRNISNALVKGGTIKIQGGQYVISSRDDNLAKDSKK